MFFALDITTVGPSATRDALRADDVLDLIATLPRDARFTARVSFGTCQCAQCRGARGVGGERAPAAGSALVYADGHDGATA